MIDLPPTERRCQQCVPGTDWRDEVAYCPHHGLTVSPQLKRVCLCGYGGNDKSYSFCVKCGKVLEDAQ